MAAAAHRKSRGSAADRAYLDGLTLLARRDVSEARVRQRLAGRGHAGDAVDRAVRRLKAERALDDDRAAGAIARTEVAVKKHGRLRVRRALEQAGIPPTTAERTLEHAFAGVDEDALIRSALARRLPPDAAIETDRDFERLGRYLAGQGFDGERIVRLLATRRRAPMTGGRSD